MQKIAIISRSFWPEAPAIGEALLLLAENLVARGNAAYVIAQVDSSFAQTLSQAKRGKSVRFATMRAFTNSASHLLWRVLELLCFSLYTFWSLCRYRPNLVYVATNPPVLLPFLVSIYCLLFNKKYIYHLQDIHPEAAQVVLKRKGVLFSILKKIDNLTIRRANSIITLTKQMQQYIAQRAELGDAAASKILLLENPSVESNASTNTTSKTNGFIYCGNAGRLQRIPLLLEAIEEYIRTGGTLPFVFAGGGVYSKDIIALANSYDKQVTYLGMLSGPQAAETLAAYTYALMPIEDEVTCYAFPSKSSSYAYAACYTIAICGENTSVAQWVTTNHIGYVASPTVGDITRLFHQLSNTTPPPLHIDPNLLLRLLPTTHAERLEEIMMAI